MKDFLKEIVAKVIVSIIVSGILLLIPATKPYFLKIITFILDHKIEVILLIMLFLIIYLFRENKKLFNLSGVLGEKIDSLKESPLTTATTAKKLSDLDNKIDNKTEKIKKMVSKNSGNLSDLERDIYPIKRNHFYKEADKYEKLGRRGALICRLNVIELDIKMNYSLNLEESLQDLFGYVKKKSAFFTQDLSATRNCLNKIQNEKHKETTNQIITLLKSKL